MQVALKGIEELSAALRLADHHPEREADHRAGPQRHHDPGLPRRQRRAARRGAGHRRPDRAPGPDQRRLRRRAHRDVRNGHGDDGHRRGARRRPCAGRGRGAIQNPLLDDVNLSGANGILVNITAGPDFTMAEFDEVGRTVEEFASEDATVVIGTVLDPDMQDEVRVTVVATGLNRNTAGRPPAGRPVETLPVVALLPRLPSPRHPGATEQRPTRMLQKRYNSSLLRGFRFSAPKVA
jgi:hypothetical protein